MTTPRDPRGRFQPGCSGNPAGKLPGTLNRVTRLKRWLATVDERTAVTALVARVTAGDIAAMRLLLDRIAAASGRGTGGRNPELRQHLQVPVGDERAARGGAGPANPASPQHLQVPTRDDALD